MTGYHQAQGEKKAYIHPGSISMEDNSLEQNSEAEMEAAKDL